MVNTFKYFKLSLLLKEVILIFFFKAIVGIYVLSKIPGQYTEKNRVNRAGFETSFCPPLAELKKFTHDL